MIEVTRTIRLSEDELQVSFVRASGPGGQNVNKVATAVQLRFDAAGSPSLSAEVRERLLRLAGKRATDDGEIIIDARRYRTQERNRQDAVERLVELIRRAAVRPKARRATKPTRASKERRLDQKRQRSAVKQGRARKPTQDD
ncbi:aminoacyl-tRNA hydrolase [bacterium]|nr:aminoacyl-tRNA hydrolase [bacterium]